MIFQLGGRAPWPGHGMERNGKWNGMEENFQFSSVNLFGEQKHKIMITNAHVILIAACFMRSPNDGF